MTELEARELERWLAALESRHLADLTVREVTRGLRALSSAYVERRGRLTQGAALSGAGKRAAFALFYGPLHYLVVRHIVMTLPGARRAAEIVDLGCGTGAAGAAWASTCTPPASVVGVDRHPWAIQEAAQTYRAFGLRHRVQPFDLGKGELPRARGAMVAAFTVNELPAPARESLLTRLVERGERSDHILVVEPIARSTSPWWDAWRTRVEQAGGRADEWRIPAVLPPIVANLDRAAGLNHRELTARSLWL
jgi:hypothetical protein